MGVGGETACDMMQGVGATLREDVLGDPTAKCLAMISDLIGSKLAEPTPHVPPLEEYRASKPACNMTQDVGATLREDVLRDRAAKCLAETFDPIGSVVIKEVLDALPNGSAITFTSDQLEALFSGGGLAADTKTGAATIEGLANTCGCSFALHRDTGTFTKNLMDTVASAKLAEPAPHVPPEEYRARADICINWARELGGDQRRNFLTLAQSYLRAAMLQEAAQPNLPPMLPVVEPSNELVFDCKTQSNGYRTPKEGLPNVRREPRVFQTGSRDQSAKRISRDSLQIAILALTVGATTGAGAVLALVGHPSDQYTASRTARPPAIIIQQAANLPTPEPASDGRRKVSDETPEHAAPPWPVALDAYGSPPMNSPSLQISGAPDRLGQMTNRTSALDMPSSFADAANEEDTRQTGRKTFRYMSTHRFTHWQHRFRHAFHRYAFWHRYRHAFHRYAFWHRYRYAFHSLRKGWI